MHARVATGGGPPGRSTERLPARRSGSMRTMSLSARAGGPAVQVLVLSTARSLRPRRCRSSTKRRSSGGRRRAAAWSDDAGRGALLGEGGVAQAPVAVRWWTATGGNPPIRVMRSGDSGT